jgi:hypothetical protein
MPLSDEELALPEVRLHGKTGVKPITHRPELYLHNFRKADYAVPALPQQWDVTKGLENVDMLGNGPCTGLPAWNNDEGVGNCVFAAKEHGRMFKALVSVDADGVPTYEEGFRIPHTAYTCEIYFQYGVAQGEVGQPPAPPDEPDEGTDPGTFMPWDIAQNLDLAVAEVDTSMAATDPTTALQNILTAAVEFDGGILCVSLTDSNMAQFNRGLPFSVGDDPADRPDPDEGHGVYLGAFDLTAGRVKVPTWGFGQQEATLAWVQACVTGFYVALTREDADRAGYDFDAMLAVLEGLQNPEVAPDAQQETPTPSTGPTEAQNLLQLARGIEADLRTLVDMAISRKPIPDILEAAEKMIEFYAQQLEAQETKEEK